MSSTQRRTLDNIIQSTVYNLFTLLITIYNYTNEKKTRTFISLTPTYKEYSKSHHLEKQTYNFKPELIIEHVNHVKSMNVPTDYAINRIDCQCVMS